MQLMKPILLVLLFCCSAIVLGDEPDSPSSKEPKPERVILFQATFDQGVDADYAVGDKRIYTAQSMERKEVKPGLRSDAVRWEKDKGRKGGALHFTGKSKQLVFFKGGKNVGYEKANFEGTVSLWMKLSPKDDLPKGYVDPLQITDKKWNDASFFVDFDQDEKRPFRLGVFSDFAHWNPTKRNFDDIPEKERPMVSVRDWPFDRNKWTSVVFTWSNFNTGKPSQASLYIDGKLQGTLSQPQQFSWDPKKAIIMLGINYVGWIDELVVLDKCLSPDQLTKFLNP